MIKSIQFRNIWIDCNLLFNLNDIFYINLYRLVFDNKTKIIRYDIICKLFGKNIDKINFNILINNNKIISNKK